MSVIPDVEPHCWPVDTSGCDGFSEYESAVRELAEALAVRTARMLTGYRLGNCPIKVRPCAFSCVRNATTWSWQGGTFVPMNISGTWVNMVCGGCGIFCNCGLGRKQITLPGHVAQVDEVKVDGVVLPSTAYEVHNSAHLVRIDGSEWPSVQAMDEPDTAAGTWSVTYTEGLLVDGLGSRIAGILACEYAKALTGAKCALPAGVTQIARQGITMTLTPGAFPDGLTGIKVVDAWVSSYNPHHLHEAPAIWSPDMPQFRTVASSSEVIVDGGTP